MSELNETIKNSVKDIAAINANIEKLKEEAKEARQAAMQPFLQALAESGAVSAIIVRGYTPGFNDGEPCEHSASMFVNFREFVEDDLADRLDEFGLELNDELVDGLNYGQHEANAALCAEHGYIYERPSAEILKAIQEIIFDTAEEENETDYYVSYLLKDGKFEVSQGDYSCGY